MYASRRKNWSLQVSRMEIRWRRVLLNDRTPEQGHISKSFGLEEDISLPLRMKEGDLRVLAVVHLVLSLFMTEYILNVSCRKNGSTGLSLVCVISSTQACSYRLLLHLSHHTMYYDCVFYPMFYTNISIAILRSVSERVASLMRKSTGSPGRKVCLARVPPSKSRSGKFQTTSQRPSFDLTCDRSKLWCIRLTPCHACAS